MQTPQVAAAPKLADVMHNSGVGSLEHEKPSSGR
jgi:hypothetical protein